MLAPHPQSRRTERGASAVEYSLLVALVAAVIFGSVAALGQGLLTDLTDFVTSWP
ncbi:Flp family type IVb pilin [Nocardioides panacisoli]|uniref:Flp family type IVb pilin n=1 Tax=Nocardioides panacisoli TaxID=627624 RepID=UPI001C639A9B|nr:Flp family type IVb pilin [Nocardioides panacisoli]QYJ04715.1 Flp family type IVb pilin [Nocardioides panacisoli]